MIECKDVIKEFGTPSQRILHGLNFNIQTGEFVSISGKSGSGKSTLLYLVSTLDLPTSGKVIFDGKNLADMSVEEIHRFRNLYVGFVFQFHYLLPELSTIENILLPARNIGQINERLDYADHLMKQLEIFDQKHKLPGQMSGGQQQRVAIARALLMKPKYIFADEPTGNLDTKNGRIVMDIFKKVNKEDHTTIVLVTHEPSYSKMADREIYLEDGRIVNRNVDEIYQ